MLLVLEVRWWATWVTKAILIWAKIKIRPEIYRPPHHTARVKRLYNKSSAPLCMKIDLGNPSE